MRGKDARRRRGESCGGITPACAGKGGLAGGRTVEHGITPAYAGKRVRCSQQALPRTDHPRMCGEKLEPEAGRLWPGGSPPHVRGKALGPCAGRVAVGITPAYAGKRRRSRQFSSRAEDHPRVCGEKFAFHAGVLYPLGSPPRMRGKECLL